MDFKQVATKIFESFTIDNFNVLPYLLTIYSSLVFMTFMLIYKRAFYYKEVMNGIANNPQAIVVSKKRAKQIIEEASNKILEYKV